MSRLFPRRVDPRDAVDGIYFDFEGFPGAPPSLVGTLIGDDYALTFLHPAFAPVAEHLGAPLVTLDDYLHTLVRKAERERRMLFAYSEHELERIAELAPHFAEEIARRYYNAHTIVRAWATRTGRPLPRGERSLKTYYAAFFEPYPEGVRQSSVPEKLARIAARCGKDPDWTTAPAKVRSMLEDLIAYNRLDCTAMRALVLRAAREEDEVPLSARRDVVGS